METSVHHVAVPAEDSQIRRLRLRNRYSDEDLLRGLQRRDPLVAAAVFDTYAASVNALVWKLMGPDSEHDDVVQQVFVHVLRDAGTLRDAAALSGWIRTIAVNTVRKEIRRRRYRRAAVQLRDVDSAYSHPAGTGAALVTRRVFAVLRQMRGDHQLYFALRYIDGNTFVEIARLTQCSLATAKRRVRRAHAAFWKRAQRDPVLAGQLEMGNDA